MEGLQDAAARRLDLSGDDLIVLFRDAVTKDVFTPAFRMTLKSMLCGAPSDSRSGVSCSVWTGFV
jgi:hypothetical protein